MAQTTEGEPTVTDTDALIQKLLGVAEAHRDLPPYETATVHLSLGELALIAKGLGLLGAVRQATNTK